jgi:Zn-finger nucleic acid-binding protein
MPYLICPSCRLEAYSAAGYTTTDRCPRCDTSLAGAERADGLLHRWKVTDLRLTLAQQEVGHGVG